MAQIKIQDTTPGDKFTYMNHQFIRLREDDDTDNERLCILSKPLATIDSKNIDSLYEDYWEYLTKKNHIDNLDSWFPDVDDFINNADLLYRLLEDNVWLLEDYDMGEYYICADKYEISYKSTNHMKEPSKTLTLMATVYLDNDTMVDIN